MSKVNDKEWIKKVTAHYQWPEYSSSLRDRVLTQVVAYKEKQPSNYFSIFQELFSSNWQPVGALVMALVLGIGVGSFTLSQNTAQAAQAGIYGDSDYVFAQSLVAQYKGKEY